MTIATSAPSAFRVFGLGYEFRPRGPFKGVVLRVSHIKRGSQELWVLLHVSADGGEWGAFPSAPKRVNLFTSTSVASTARYFAAASGRDAPTGTDWQVMLDAFAAHIVTAESVGVPFKWVEGDEPDKPEPPDLVEKLVQAQQINLLFAPQGSGKGWLCMALGLCVQYGLPFLNLQVHQTNVLYLDYEADQETFKRRLRAVAIGLEIPNPRLRWLKPPTELVECREWLSRMVADEKVGLVIWDSVGRGTTPPGEHTTWESNAREITRVADAIQPAALLLIDHVTGEGTREKLAGKAMGGIRKMADARVAWEARLEQDAEADHLVMGLWHTKFNNTRKFAPIGIRADFESDDQGRAVRVTFGPANLSESEKLGETVKATRSQREQVLDALSYTEPQLVADLATITQIAVNTVGARLRDLHKSGHARRIDDGQSGPGAVTQWLRAVPPKKGDNSENLSPSVAILSPYPVALQNEGDSLARALSNLPSLSPYLSPSGGDGNKATGSLNPEHLSGTRNGVTTEFLVPGAAPQTHEEDGEFF